MNNPYPQSPEEQEALVALRESGDPMATVIYHMSMRQLAMSEMLSEMAGQHQQFESRQQKIVDYIDNRVSNGSKPNLRAIVFGTPDGAEEAAG